MPDRVRERDSSSGSKSRRKLNIWIVHTGEPLPGAGAEMHAFPLARELVGRGHQVLWWNTAFDHFSKSWIHRDDTEIEVSDRLTVFAIKGPGYPSNTSVRRLLDHRVVAQRWRNLARSRVPPDLIICAMPPHDLAFKVVRFANANGIPVIVDLRDPWPDALLDLIPSWSRIPARLLLSNDFRMLRQAIRDSDSLVAVTHSLLEWGRVSARRSASETDRVFYTGAKRVGQVETSPSLTKLLRQISTSFIVVFVGSFGFYHSPFIAIDAARSLTGTDIHFVLAGSGDTLDELKRSATGLPNVHFTGWLSSGDAAALMRSGRIGICPTTSAQPILPNKAAAYFREGLPVVSSFEGDLRQLIDEHNVGVNYLRGDVDGFTKAILLIRNDERLLSEMSAAARRLYDAQFDAERNLVRFADHAESVAASNAERV